MSGPRRRELGDERLEHGGVVAALEARGKDERPAADVLQREGELAGAIGGVDVDEDESRTCRGKHRQDPLRAIRRPDADTLPRPQAAGEESAGDALDAEVERVARGFLACGLRPGERVGIWAPNCAEWILTMFAAARAGLILVNINPAYRTSELEFALNLVGCRAL